MLEKRSHECRVSLKPSAREDVPAERTWLEKRTLLERREAVELRVDALQGSRDSFPVLFLFGFMCKCLWEGACRGYSRIV